MPKPLTLIVEDDRRLGETLTDLFELLGLRVEYGADSARARQQMGELKPDLILLDLPLYNRGGLDFLSDLQSDLRLRDAKVIVITTEQYAETADLRLADAVLIKPFSFDLLEATVNTLVGDLAASDDGKLASFSGIQP